MTINAHSHPIEIKLWQEFLKKEGYIIQPDGIWGPPTNKATKQFQTKYSLEPDGIVGPNTFSKAKNLGFNYNEKKMGFKVDGNIDKIFDISHHNQHVDFRKAKEFGMVGLFHKASQSVGSTFYKDPMYRQRKEKALSNKLLWGAYHFGTFGDGRNQAREFLKIAYPSNDTLLVLDLERCTTTGERTMTIEQVESFIREVKAITGRYPGIYGGALLKQITQNDPRSIPMLSRCWLWIAQYSARPTLPKGWSNYTFWQYTDGKHGQSHKAINGVGVCDRSMFRGTSKMLNDFWTSYQV